MNEPLDHPTVVFARLKGLGLLLTDSRAGLICVAAGGIDGSADVPR